MNALVAHVPRGIERTSYFLIVASDTSFRVFHGWFKDKRTIIGLQRFAISSLIHVCYPVLGVRHTTKSTAYNGSSVIGQEGQHISYGVKGITYCKHTPIALAGF